MSFLDSSRMYLARTATSLVLLAALGAAPVLAQELVMGMASAPTSIDPHFHANSSNISMTGQVFEGLTWKDEFMQPHASLAESWDVTEDGVWTFHLRQGVTFHNGEPFTADDVVFTFDRLPTITDSPSPFTARLADIESYRAIDEHTLEVVTKGAAPNLPINLADVQIVSRAVGEGKTTDDYVTGEAMIGTGPYKFVSARIGEVYEFARNDDYWGETPAWETVTQRVIGSDPARVAALLSGDVDLISDVPVTDFSTIEANPDMRLWSTGTSSIAFIAIDVEHEKPIPGQATDLAGNDLPVNPMLDQRVRHALSMAIDRVGLVERGLSNDAYPASQLVPEGMFGFNPDIPVEPFDLEGAKALLAEAGYPDGFKVVLSTSNDDTMRARSIQAVAQMWTRAGVQTTVETMPHAVFIPKTNDFEYAHMIHSWGTSTGEAAYTLRGIAGTRDHEHGIGTSNRGRYSNPEVDAMVTEASSTVDDAAREELLRRAMAIVVAEDYGLIPLYNRKATWASNASVVYTPSRANVSNALFARPAE
ncbi:ABC transporter substrate-binding protein [Devosia ginsengisoli]|uniref:ABC transporter substrate-binding protein n=1 Tax=Devosia ginsengisoli TaxID=400770 RepID=UPI0026F041CB|nr:ABC transporter substrate-binding protein [Devosia ginsengisoli]MCR6670067.1 ABC transporter substrate-binding protein [Devosia ginsengisoli]